MAVKTVARKATKPRAAKRAARRATRRAARKAVRAASKPKAPKAARKARKSKRVTKKSQTGTMRQVWNGTKVYTKSRHTKKDLCKVRGHIMTKKQFKYGQRVKKSGWMKAVSKARKELKIKGFVLMNRGTEGKALYKLAKSYM